MLLWSPLGMIFPISSVSSLCCKQLGDFVLQGAFLIAQLAHFLEEDPDFSSQCFTKVVHISGIGQQVFHFCR